MKEQHARPAPAPCGMDLLTGLTTRRSIRQFTGEAIPDDTLRALVLAGLSAPSARNRRPYEFVVLRSRETFRQLAEANPYAHMLPQADAVLVVCGDANCEQKDEFLQQTCGAAVENILLAAHGLGLGAVWCGVRTGSDWEALLGRVMHLPEGVRAMQVVALGHPAETPAPRDYWTPEKLHWETWD